VKLSYFLQVATRRRKQIYLLWGRRKLQGSGSLIKKSKRIWLGWSMERLVIWPKNLSLAMKNIVCFLLLLVGSWLMFLNWKCFYTGFVKKQPSPSWIPLAGGGFVFIGICIFPSNSMNNFAWLVLFIDWGCIPGIGHAILYHVYHKIKRT